MPISRRKNVSSQAPKTVEERHGDLEDYPEDALNNVEAYYIYREPNKYSREKVEALLGSDRNSDRRKWTQAYVNHAIEHIESEISAQFREQERKAQEVFERAKAEAEARREPPQYRREAVYPQLAIAIVTIKGQRHRFWRDPSTGRFASVRAPEQIPQRAVSPKELEKK